MRFTDDTDKLRRCFDSCGVAYLHAPFFSPAMKAVGGVRRALGVRTFFNMLGPLVNPVMPHYQLLGVYNLKLMRLYNYICQENGTDCTIVHSLDGYDEVSLTGPFKVAGPSGEHVYTPEDLGFSTCAQNELWGGDSVGEAAGIFDNVLSCRATKAQRDCVVANAAFAILTLKPSAGFAAARAQAEESLDSGRALEAFRRFVGMNS